jgi:hypothetical protein
VEGFGELSYGLTTTIADVLVTTVDADGNERVLEGVRKVTWRAGVGEDDGMCIATLEMLDVELDVTGEVKP